MQLVMQNLISQHYTFVEIRHSGVTQALISNKVELKSFVLLWNFYFETIQAPRWLSEIQNCKTQI